MSETRSGYSKVLNAENEVVQTPTITLSQCNVTATKLTTVAMKERPTPPPSIARRQVWVGTEVVYGFRLCRITHLNHSERGWIATIKMIKRVGHDNEVNELVAPLHELKRAR